MALPVTTDDIDIDALDIPAEQKDKFRELQDLYQREELDADLERYLDDREDGRVHLRHPLVYSIFYHPIENRRLNIMLQAKRAAICEYERERKWASIMWLYERPWRLAAFAEYCDYMSDTMYWTVLGQLWVDSENIWQNYQEWHDALHSERPRKWAMMGPEDRKAWRKLRRNPHPLLVRRGYATDGATDEAHTGMSWTLNRQRADWFARRFAGMERREHAMTALGIIDPEKVIAYFDCRNEDEVVVLPEDVHIVRIEEL